MDRMTPREIIALLDVDQIDEEISSLEEEISALRALRKVAMAKNGHAPAAKSRGKSISSGMQERLDTAVEVLKKWEKLDGSKLAERAGCRQNSTHWFLKAIAKDSRFSIDGETVTLSNPSA